MDRGKWWFYSSFNLSKCHIDFWYCSAPQHHIPPLVPVTHSARELWEDVIINILINLIIFFFDYFSIEIQLKLRHKNVCINITNEKAFILIYFLSVDISMPATFQMIPLKMSILDIEGTKTYFFKVILNNFVRSNYLFYF